MTPTGYIAGIFGRSPIAALQQHIILCRECAGELIPFVQAVLDQDRDAILAHRKRIEELEDEADEVKKQARLHLPNSLFLPVSRADLLEILRVQDRIANRTKDISGLMVGRRMNLPEPFGAPFLHLVERAVATAEQSKRSVCELDELFEAGFRSREADSVKRMIEELSDLESETDELQIELRSVLFALEPELPPVDVMFYYRIIDLTGDLADMSLRVGARLLLLLAK
jgi:uncharacterized protein